LHSLHASCPPVGIATTATALVASSDSAQPDELAAYFALVEAVSLLQHAVDQQLRSEGDLTYIQFQLLARLSEADGALTMTELADGVVYSRSGVTYQAGLLEKAGLITRSASPDDERCSIRSPPVTCAS
jgi:DNA-binding MarR family transcriptional regulator